MPITIPEHYLKIYNNDKEHFNHVREFLLAPILDELNIEVVHPLAQGSESIPLMIIQNIISCDLVLCDISVFNPNVFFELGFRTAINKPVCIIRDNFTKTIPFDNSSINIEMYNSDLRPWSIDKTKAKLKKHIISTLEKSSNKNALLSSFGLSDIIKPIKEDENILSQEELDELFTVIEGRAEFIGP